MRLWLTLWLGLCACPKPEAPPPPSEERAPRSRPLELDEEELARAGIRTEPVKRAALHPGLVLTGEVVAQPDRTAKLSSPTPGRLEQVSFNEGSAVKRGDVLATVRVPDVGRLRGAFAAARARAKAARANAQRLAELKSSGLGSEQALIDAEADARAQEAEASALGEQLAAIGVNADSGAGFLVALRAPITGVVVMRDAVVGQPLNTEHVLATLVDLSEVWFLGRVFEKDLAKLHVGAKARLQLNAFPEERFEGSLDYLSQQIDPAARTLTARIRVPNPDQRLRLGLFGRAHVELPDTGKPPQLVVPREAVLVVSGQPVVFVKTPRGFVLREVTPGEAALDEVQLLGGVSEGEEVVISGAFTLKSLLLKSTLGEDE